MKIKSLPQVEPGDYHGTFLGAAPTSHKDYGAGIKWDFRIDDGFHAGAIVRRTTGDTASAKNTCARFAEMVSGFRLQDAVTFDTDDWIGVTGKITVEHSPSGESMRVAKFVRDDESQDA